MRYLQENKVFAFRNSNNSLDEFYADIVIDYINVEFCINKKYFKDEQVDWNFVQEFTSHFIKNFDFINKKTKKMAIILYNEYGNIIESEEKFIKDNCYFINQLLVELMEPPEIVPYPNNILHYLVDNIFNNEFTYLNSTCIFADYGTAYFVGVKASSIDD